MKLTKSTIGLCCAVLFMAIVCMGAHAQTSQTWVKVANEDDTITASAPITYRFGVPQGAQTGSAVCTAVGGCWDAPVTTSGPLTLQVYSSSFAGGDPAPDIVKQLQVLETSVAQTVNDTPPGGTTVSVPIPALPLIPVTIPVGQAYTVTLSINRTSGATGPSWFGMYDIEASGANTGWEGPLVNLTIGGIALTCSYVPSPGVPGGVFTLNCTVPR
jgi:hypothetical protein